MAGGSGDDIRVGKPATAAVGIPGIAQTVRYAVNEMGLRRGGRTLLRLNQTDGFDCPSCAWPDPAPQDRSTVELCENGAKAASWEATRARAGRALFAKHSVGDLRRLEDHSLEHRGRLVEPMHLGPGATHYAPISWEGAFELIAGRLRALSDPNRAAFYTSGRASNEAAFVYQLLARRFGTNNLPDCSNMCHESTSAALNETIGIGKGAVSLADITDHAELIVIVGQNPGTNHPRMLSALDRAKKRGARIVAANPLPEAGLLRFKNPQALGGLIGGGTKLADLFLAVRVNGDLAMFAAVNKALIALEDAAPGSILDHPFIEGYCAGFDEARAAWRRLEWPVLEAQSGLSRRQIDRFAAEVVAARSVVVCWAMGITQHRNAVATIREIVNFLLLRGNIGRAGAGPCPIRGHSNVQGDRTMGVCEAMSETFGDRLRDEFGFDPPRRDGFDTVDTIRALRDGRIDVFVALGGNFVAAAPDTAVTEAAMSRAALTVHVATKLNRSHLYHGSEALLLPCLGRTELDVQAAGEQYVTVEDSMSNVHASRGHLPPVSEHLRSEVAIVCGLGQALFGADLGWKAMGDDYRVIRRHIANVVEGFEDFENRVHRPGGFTLPRGPRDSRTFHTPTGRAVFSVNPPDALEVPEGHLVLQTLRSHDQFNTTVYGFDDRYRGIKGGRRVVLVNSQDLVERGLRDGDMVDLVSVWPDGERRAPGFRAVRYPTPRGCAAAYFPEANVLVPLDSTALGSNTPTSKSVIIRIEPAADRGGQAVAVSPTTRSAPA